MDATTANDICPRYPSESHDLEWVADPDIAGPGIILSVALVAVLSLLIVVGSSLYTYSGVLASRLSGALQLTGTALLDQMSIAATAQTVALFINWTSFSAFTRTICRLLVSISNASGHIIVAVINSNRARHYGPLVVTTLESLALSIALSKMSISTELELTWLENGNLRQPTEADLVIQPKSVFDELSFASDVLSILLMLLMAYCKFAGLGQNIIRASQIACLSYNMIRLFADLNAARKLLTYYIPYCKGVMLKGGFGQLAPLALLLTPMLASLGKPSTSYQSSSPSSLIPRWIRWNQESPPPSGYRRLSWTCSCGHSLAGNFSNSDPTALEALENRLRRLSNSDAQESSDQASEPSAPVSHATQAVSSSTSPEFSRLPSRREEHMASENIQVSSRRNVRPSDTSQRPRIPKFLELCVAVGRHSVRLGEINISSVTTDGQLFTKIWESYCEIRTSSFMSVIKGWCFKPSDISFVHFGVIGRHRVGIFGKPMEIPPPQEVDGGRYHYHECPMQPLPPMPGNIFLHYLEVAKKANGCQDNHESHAENVFLSRLPKKVGCSIFTSNTNITSSIAYGWGVHIVERPSAWAKSMLGMISALVCIIIFAMTWSCAGFGTAVGIGQYVGAVLALVNAAFYFALQDYSGALSRE
ncbi:HET-like protein [Fusarium austroafricanum]|uniref:HET-like protein n=1 Tax=Fusarium austroafricanum TaxID=2364996 RepID=A0A8H4KB39_9HYPO|nr:HET-like protein [Fusarium austroafricanum]